MRAVRVVAFFFFCACWGGNALWAEEDRLPAATRPVIALHRSACGCRQCFVAETANFRVHCCTSTSRLQELAETFERLRSRGQQLWLGDSSPNWEPRCEVVIHATVANYSRTLGPGSERTSGCATIRLDQGRVAERRIDLRSDAEDWLTESLPHELTHVVLADRFTARRIPAWADEGIAMLAESPEKLERRLRDLHEVIATNRTLRLRELVALEDGPTSANRAAFYGQSVSLTGLLLELGSPEQFVRFTEAGQRDGYDAALRDTYGIESWTSLEAHWREYAGSQRLRRLARHAFDRPMPDRRLTLMPKASPLMAD